MSNSNYIKTLRIFVLFGFLILSSVFAQGSSNSLYIGPSGEIEGVVTDDAGKPIANANVFYTSGTDNMGFGFYYALTDEEGNFSIENVIPGSGTLSASARRYEDAKEDIEVTTGKVTEQTIKLTPVETGTIKGTVKNAETETPVAGVDVSAFPNYYFPGMMTEMMKSDGMGNMAIVKNEEGLDVQKVNPSQIKKKKAKSDRKHRKHKIPEGEKLTGNFASLFFPNYYMEDTLNQAVTDSNGNYTFENLPVGSYTIYVDLEAKSGFAHPDAQYPELEVGDTEIIDFSLKPLKTGTVSGTVKNPKEEPVFGAIIDIYNDNFYGYTVSDKDGNYSMLSVPEGDYQITAINQGFWLSSNFYSVTVKEGENSTVDIKFKEYPTEVTPMPGKGETTSNNSFMGKAGEMMMERKIGK
ncbi:MAG: hypothetical protein A2042_06105 [Candidatus Schekmanbacteria bacterium GWA2_38_11]|uniref:Carboxypeptidase regulatory-like domain-containing protein n=1 Tax=Candidatus Schekmanbacteria bacterium GWA2_38_11 TaxID=1817876 RepID=A0A1F7RNV1_9BACT|nr:MAG: hypothetical protein A2042_06105 [Candidatus Schekmanbacteria bacterium GWA2_38_11]